MMSREMERWRLFFENSGEDLWSVIDWALTIAAVNYPKELRMRRDGYAEKLFAPSNYPLVSSNCGGGAPLMLAGGSEARKENIVDHGHDHDHDQGQDQDQDHAEADEENGDARTCVTAPSEEDGEEAVTREVLSIGESLDEGPQSEDEILKALQRLEQLQVSFQSLKATGIGMAITNLRRRHPSKRVQVAAKKLVRQWKGVVDEWAKTVDAAATAEFAGSAVNDMEVIEERLPHRVDLLSSSVSSVTQPPPLQILENGGEDSLFGCSPAQERQEAHRISYPPSEHSNMLNAPKYRPEGDEHHRTGPRVTIKPPAPNASARKPPTKPSKPQESAEKQKLETTKRLIHDQYQQAANVKRQRTVQVMDMQDVPQDRPGANPKAGVGNSTRRPVQR